MLKYLIALFIALCIFLLIDRLQSITQTGEGVIVDKDYTAPYTTWSSSHIGSNSHSYPVYHEARYHLLIQVDDQSDWLEVPPLDYSNANVGMHVAVRYNKGCFTHALYVHSIDLKW